VLGLTQSPHITSVWRSTTRAPEPPAHGPGAGTHGRTAPTSREPVPVPGTGVEPVAAPVPLPLRELVAADGADALVGLGGQLRPFLFLVAPAELVNLVR
jgi:hypothetical protein